MKLQRGQCNERACLEIALRAIKTCGLVHNQECCRWGGLSAGGVCGCRSTKITIERPRGLKANLQRLLQQRTEEDMQRVVAGEERYRRLFFSLCWLHSLLVERGKFHNVGWNTAASFSDSDFFVGDCLLATYCDQVSYVLKAQSRRFRVTGCGGLPFALCATCVPHRCPVLAQDDRRASLGSSPLQNSWCLLWRPFS